MRKTEKIVCLKKKNTSQCVFFNAISFLEVYPHFLIPPHFISVTPLTTVPSLLFTLLSLLFFPPFLSYCPTFPFSFPVFLFFFSFPPYHCLLLILYYLPLFPTSFFFPSTSPPHHSQLFHSLPPPYLKFSLLLFYTLIPKLIPKQSRPTIKNLTKTEENSIKLLIILNYCSSTNLR